MAIARLVKGSGALFCLALLQALSLSAAAQEGWKASRPDAQPANAHTSPRAGSAVERGEPAPVAGSDASALPNTLWQGLDLKTLEQLLVQLDLPPRSPALAALWRRLLLSTAAPPAGVPSADHFVALRLEALYRSGLIEDMQRVLDESGASGPVIEALRARRDIGLGQREAGCQAVKPLTQPNANLPGRLKGEAQLLAGYCAAIEKNAQGAGLAAELAREEGIDAEVPLAVLAGIAADSRPQLRFPRRVLLLDYRFLELLGAIDASRILDKAEPALLAALARHIQVEPQVQIAAAEAALRLNALPADAVADIYRRSAAGGGRDREAQTSDAGLRHALFFKGAEVAQTAPQRARLLRPLAEDARRSGYFVQMARLIDPLLAELQPSADSAWFAETATEAALAAGRYADARGWAQSAALRHWLPLIDIANPQRRSGAGLAPIEQLATRGQLGADALHKLVAVLDALDIGVPIALWDAAGRLPQASAGYLPETGVLADLGQSARRNEVGRTALLAMRVLGPGGPDGANVLGLGDAVRALKRVGLEADARRLALEALLGVWPRAVAN